MDYKRVNNDINGNPRYVFHWLNFLSRQEWHDIVKKCKYIPANEIGYKKALKKSRAIGGKKYRGKDFGGGIVLQSYNISATIEQIKNIQDGL